MSFLDEIALQHEELESPKAFWRWAALAAISAVVKDKVYFNKHLYNLYPNIYVMLHADSGLKKGPPISMAKKLVGMVNNTKIISGRSSIQGILKDMGTAKTAPGGKITSQSSVFICSSELTSSIVSDPVAMDILTDLYDRQYNDGKWQSLLKMESFSLNNPTLTMLVGTNEAHSDDFFARKDVQGGYFARTFIIHESKRNKVNSLMFQLENPPNYIAAAEYLKELAKLEGSFEMSHATRTYFNDWYVEFCNVKDLQQIKDPTGTLNRFDDAILKTAMLISLGRSPDLEITQTDLETAIKECEKLVGNVRKTTMGRGKSVWATEKALVIQELLNRDNHTISRLQLNKKYYLHANSSEWDEIMVSLEAAGIVKIESHGNQVMYVMPEKIAAEFKVHLAGKQ
jgi:hypothetical protein